MSRSRHAAGSRTATLAAVALIGCAAAAGCESEPSATGASVRDSAGVRIVENGTPIHQVPQWRLEAEPDVRIGMLDGPAEYQFYRVGDTRHLADGRIVVVNAGSPMIRIFGSAGEYLGGLGEEGEGPEEFQAPLKVWPAGDTLLVLDIGLQRLATWTADGRFLRVDPILPRFLNEPFPGGRFSDGSLLLTNLHLDIPESGFEWVPLFLHRYGPDGALMDTVARYPGRQFGILSRERGMVGSPHFSARTTVAARGSRVVVATGRAYEVELLDPAGAKTGVVRWIGPPRDVSDDDVARLRAGRLEGIDDPGQLDFARDVFEGTPVEPEFATTQDVGIATTGEIWVREYDRPGADPGRHWLVFDPDGGLIGRILLPENFMGYEAGPDYILGVERDDLDVEYVVRYRFERTAAAP